MKHLLLLSILLGQTAATKLEKLAYEEDATLQAQLHVALQPDSEQHALYLAIHNRFSNTIECGGQFLAVIEKDGEVVNLLLRFANLRVLPAAAFPYVTVHLVASSIDLPSGYTFVLKEYQPLKAHCRGWDHLQVLHPVFCQSYDTARTQSCSADKVFYQYMIDEYWIGACLC